MTLFLFPRNTPDAKLYSVTHTEARAFHFFYIGKYCTNHCLLLRLYQNA